MSAFRFKASHGSPTAAEVRLLRGVCPLGISEILRRSAAREALLEIPVFSTIPWAEAKAQVVSLLNRIESGELPLLVYSSRDRVNQEPVEEHMSVASARARLVHLREIVLAQDMLSQLESGEISSHEEYVPLPEDEA